VFERVLIVSGPTWEPLDPVRFLGNRSSGRTGLHLAAAFAQEYAREVVFVSGPVCEYPEGVRLVKVETALQMQAEVFKHFATAQVLIMVAAVADFRPAHFNTEKISKADGVLQLELTRNPDILAEAGARRSQEQILVGFAAETNNALVKARRKLLRKRLDLLVINEVSVENPAFGAVCNRVTLMTADGLTPLPAQSKEKLAYVIAREVVSLAEKRRRLGASSG